MGGCLEQRAARRAKMSFDCQSWMILQIVFASITTVLTQGKQVENKYLLVWIFFKIENR